MAIFVIPKPVTIPKGAEYTTAVVTDPFTGKLAAIVWTAQEDMLLAGFKREASGELPPWATYKTITSRRR